jgi:phosphoglycerol transferase MdoB-like AlkP superfamily enzyme
MSEQQSSNIGGGIGIGTILGVVFIVLKLTDVIDWSWWWVLSPFWIPAVLFGTIFSTTLVLAGLSLWLGKVFNK